MSTITDEQVKRAEELLRVERKIIGVLKALPEERRLPVLRAVAILYGVEIAPESGRVR